MANEKDQEFVEYPHWDDTMAKVRLEAFKQVQLRDPSKPCPRCGRKTMNPEGVLKNAVSRHADVYVCDTCGTEEALQDFSGTPDPLKEWAYNKSFFKREN